MKAQTIVLRNNEDISRIYKLLIAVKWTCILVIFVFYIIIYTLTFSLRNFSVNKTLKQNNENFITLSFDNVKQFYVYYIRKKIYGSIFIKSAISRTTFKCRIRDASALVTDKNRYLLFHFLRALFLFLFSFSLFTSILHDCLLRIDQSFLLALLYKIPPSRTLLFFPKFDWQWVHGALPYK